MDAPLEQEHNVADESLDAVELQPEAHPGSRIGRYEITGSIGRGVYSARDTELGRVLAVKFVAGGARGERLIEEAQAASAMNHPNIVTIHDVVREGGQTAIAMEFVEGCPLSEKCGTPQSPGEVIRWGRQIARALAAAHSQGIVHGDIRPENLILRPDGYVKVLDFGLSRRDRSQSASAEFSLFGALGGTLRYMSPEQIRDEPATAAGDIFSLGCVLYELVCGSHPFESTQLIETGYAISHQEPRPAADHCRDGSPALNALLLETMSKEPALRPCAREVEHRLAALVSSSSGGAPRRLRIGRRPGRRVKTILTAAATVGAAVGMAFLWPGTRKMTPAEANVIRFTVPMPPGIRASSVTISPRGDQIAYFAGGDQGNLVYRRYLDSNTSLPIAGSEFGAEPFFSPSGEEIGFFVPGKIRITQGTGYRDIDTGMLAERVHGDWSPDGWIYFDSVRDKVTSVFRVRAAGGTPELVLSSLETPTGIVTRTCRQSFPDGLLFSIASSPAQCSIGWLDARNHSTRTLLDHAMGGQILPTGHLLYFWNGDLMAAPFDLRLRKVTGSAIEVVKGVSVARFGFAGNAAVSDNGTLVYLKDPGLPKRRMAWLTANGSETPFDFPDGAYEQIEISPDGKALALVQQTEHDRWTLSLVNVQTKKSRTLYEGKFPYMRAIWSPDSRRLVVSLIPDGQQFANLFLIPVDAPEKMEQLTHERLYNQFPTSWSGSANAILFTEGDHPGTGYDTMLLPLETGRPKLLVRTPGGERTPSFSPDGRWFTYTTDIDEGVWVQDLAQTRPPRRITNRDDRNPLWSPFGDRIYYLEGNNAVMETKVDKKGNTGAPHRVLTASVPMFPDATSRGYSVARDRRILILHDAPNQSLVGSEIDVVVNWFTELKRLLPVD